MCVHKVGEIGPWPRASRPVPFGDTLSVLFTCMFHHWLVMIIQPLLCDDTVIRPNRSEVNVDA